MSPSGLPVAVLAAAIALAAACGKKEDAGRGVKLSLALAVPAGAPADALSGLPAAAPGERLPSWTRESPRIYKRGGRGFASAVGSARVKNAALARVAATERARAGLLRLLKGGAAGEGLSGVLRGARVTDAFTAKARGEVFVRVEIEQTPMPP